MAVQEEQRPVLRLASASPRRRQLLDLIGVPHVVTPADIDEAPLANEPGAEYVTRLAREKAMAVRGRLADLPVLAADTTVHVDGHILEKPQSEQDCIRMLSLLSGRRHQVYTGICVLSDAAPAVRCAGTEVEFRAISRAEMQAYWASGEPQGKAGAYAIQGLGAVFVAGIVGSYTGVMGLPLFETAELLRLHGVAVWHGALRGGVAQ
ncbi:MAG TPA: Maf family protein [Steroidobacteraceae bacterium]|jgi:septum formation protein|nr:Maf family protein [Steroidobacteraceae bacterium]